ncbi:hypothetical protein CJD36_021875 [Flavipsychrobacter stenotrophus]|uniref:Protein kinase domain-containing protein n=1 Tax=Flavipsychrobacter stenotrophus TaxID=2077091 RepID=A0A2S7SQL5_9BACT|nr:lipopolysaccharide core heptose(II) kinase RfaY [Flavipsychrobacter stenotrophus]PQJ08917.1 hypothetical protein CJD36_021875 [Flavipsychrobacter stenotrophus]
MIDEQIKSGNKTYTVIRLLAEEGRPNANVYLCQDEAGQKFVAKHFYGTSPSAVVGLSVHNHYGRRRDGSQTVFNEIQKCHSYDFIVKHIERLHFKGKWLIILEYIDGEMLGDFIRKTLKTDIELVKRCIKNLAETLSQWHNNGFAHGDPHLNNAMVQPNNNHSVKLIDYSQIHHDDFQYCREYDCFASNKNRRITEDLENDFNGKIGEGFRYELLCMDEELGLDTMLTTSFDIQYKNSHQV